MIHLFPIEPLEERYSADWYRWWPKRLATLGFSVMLHDGERLTSTIKTGQFLDAVDTHYWKAHQLASFLEEFNAAKVHDGDIVLLLDGWSPQVTSLAYVRDVTGIDFKIVGLLHAGTWDVHDHLSRCGMGRWAKHNERGWLEAFDAVLLATEFHKNIIAKHSEGDISGKLYVTGFPLELEELDHYRCEKDEVPTIVFPHRLAPEKRPQDFDAFEDGFRATYPDMKVRFLRTQKECVDKLRYYQALARSKVAFSSALQETWGIAQLEAWYLGAQPVVPDRLSYCELYPDVARYNTIGEAIELAHAIITGEVNIEFFPARDPRHCWQEIQKVLWSL
jgi:hypothetical protein